MLGLPFSSVQSLSHIQLFVTPWTAASWAFLSITNSWSLLKLMWSSRWCHPTISSLLLPPSIFPSIRVFPEESVLHIRWPKYWNFSFSISPSNECSGLISFMIGWLDLLAVQGTLKNESQEINGGPGANSWSPFSVDKYTKLKLPGQSRVEAEPCPDRR